MRKPKVSVVIVSIDNDQETGDFVRIRDYDRHIFLFIYVLFTDNGPCVKIRKEFISSEVMDKFYEEKKQYYVDNGGWNISLTSSFNPTVEMLTDEKAFEKRFGPILGEAETHHTFKHSMQRELKDYGGQYQIKTAHEGAW